MRRAVARGRLVPQSRSTDPRLGRVSLKAATLYDRMWINADDQGRLSGDPDEIKYTTCPNLPDISKDEIPDFLNELESQRLIKVYNTSKTIAVQMLDWWEEQKLQWAQLSQYPPPEGWTDHLRYHLTPTEIKTENWPPTGLPSGIPSKLANGLPNRLPSKPANPLGSNQTHEELGEEIRVELMSLPDFKSYLVEHEMVREALANLGTKKGCLPKQEVTTALGRVDLCWEGTGGEFLVAFEIDAYSPKKKSLAKLKALACPYSFVILRSNPEPFQWEQDIALIGLGRARGKKSKSRQGPLPSPEIEKEIEKEEEEGRLPSALGSKPSPSPTDLCTDIHKILDKLLESFRIEFGRVPAELADEALARGEDIEPSMIIPREPSARERTQIRNLAAELVRVGGCPLSYIREAFREASAQNIKSKMSISYVRAILLDWLGIERNRSP